MSRSSRSATPNRPTASAPRTPRPAPAPLLLTVEEAAAALGVGRTLMFELIARGDIRTVRVGRLRRVRPDDLHEYVAALGV